MFGIFVQAPVSHTLLTELNKVLAFKLNSSYQEGLVMSLSNLYPALLASHVIGRLIARSPKHMHSFLKPE
jgi:hypothetical protein